MTTPHDSDTEAQTKAQRGWFRNCAIIHGNDEAREKKRRDEAAEYGDSSTWYWKLYGSEAEISDQKLVETLTADTGSMLLLNGLFSSIIASFIIETYKTLQPDNNQETVCLLSQLVSPGTPTRQPSQFCPGPYPGAPSTAAIRSNILLLISFFLSMMSALACTLIQQWCREFMKFAYPRVAPHKRGRVRTYLFQGLDQFQMRRFMYGVHVLLHISVFLFFCGVSDFLHNIYPKVGTISWYCVIVSTAAYTALSILPLVIGNCPYQTALTPPLQFGSTLLFFFSRTAWRWLWRGQKGNLPQRKERHFNKSRYLVEEANRRSAHLDPYALQWLFTDNDFTDTDMDKFLEGLPGYIHSHFTDADSLPDVLAAPFILRRIKEHFLTCAAATELSEEARIKRVSTCVESLLVILPRTSTDRIRVENSDEGESLQMYMQGIVDGFNTLCNKPDKAVDLRASCIRALAFQGLLDGAAAASKDVSPNDQLSDHFIPLYTTLFSWDNTSQAQQQNTVSSSAGVSDKSALPDEGEMLRALRYDGPLINLALLARDILSQVDVDSSSLSMCWKTLDILLSKLRATDVDISDHSLARFDEVHHNVSLRAENEEPGFSVFPLLEILDAVVGGRRLSMVFRDHPEYCVKKDLVFRKDHLRNPDLFVAFANCLPEFVAERPGIPEEQAKEQAEKSMEFMEGLVGYDKLWTSLQVHLSNSLRSNSSIPVKLRVFNRCCMVIDAAFAALENSQKVNWRAPDLGSLAHYFELFVTDCFQGMFIERAIGFRVGLIKARFCKVVLASFLDEFTREGIVVFRSHWDVASLARVFYSIGVGNDADVDFWKSFVDGGPIGAELMAKTYTMLDTASRDGPLLNLCKLGRLGMIAMPFTGSGLVDKDFEKLSYLLQKMSEDPRLLLASTPVWEDLDRLRDEVVRVRERSSEEDKTKMQNLIAKIDTVYNRRSSLASTQELGTSDRVQIQVSETPAVEQPNSPSGGQIPGNDRYSYASTSTAVDQHDISPTREDDSRGNTPAPFNNPRGELANFYSNPYPSLPSQIGPSGVITRPISASFLPSLAPLSESTDRESPGIQSINRDLPSRYMRYNDQHPHAPVYYPPRGTVSRSDTLSSLQTPKIAPLSSASDPSNIWLGPSNNGVHFTTPPASESPVEETK